ncbi:MAG: MmcQ/YjbR family DNA-binding protein [Verrucomicrobiae bacterium]|nr:MmcQ/YjbR family DNA-binding protein [Verrucomicrobiae bacterium]
MTSEAFRKLALAIPTAVELSHMNHPDFRIAGKIFATLGYPDEGWGMVKLTPEQQRLLVEKAPGVFNPCNGAWGRQGCTNVHLESATVSAVRSALGLAAENVLRRAGRKTDSR